MKKRLLAAALSAALAISLLAGCSTPGSKTSDKKESGKKEVTYTLREEPPTLDPQLANNIPTSTVCIHTCEGLTRNVEGDIRNAGAESYKMSEDGLTYTFKLRKDAKWSDGKEITAKDYVYGMQRLVDPKTATDYAFIGAILKNGEEVTSGKVPVSELGVKALDDYTVEVQLEHPASYFPSMLSMAQFAPCRKDYVEKYGKEFSADPDKAVYSGPFKVTKWAHGDEIVISRNDKYWDKDNVKLDNIVIKTVSDAKTGVAMFEQGDVDITNVPTEMTDKYKDKSKFFFDGAEDYLALNMAEGRPLQNKNLRLALNFALNRKEYITLSSNDVYEAAQRYVLPQVNGAKKSYGEEYPYEAFPLTGDQTKAKEYLKAAMQEMGVASPSDIKIELLTTDTEMSKKQAEVIQDQLQKSLGIKITIKQVTYKQRLQMESDKDFDMVFTGWVPDYSDPYSYLEIWLSDSPYNHASYNNPKYDELLKKSQTEVDPKKRMDELFEAEKIFLADGGVMPLQLRRTQVLLNDKITNFNTYFVGYDYDLVYADIKK